MPAKNEAAGEGQQVKRRQHKATYAKDKLKGGYLVRVEGPHSNRFSGRVVPVVRRDDTESEEMLSDIVWTGTDDESGKPVTLYQFEKRPVQDDYDF